MTSRLDKARAAFTKVYDENIWHLDKVEPRPDIVQRIATKIEDTIRKYDVRTVTEFGCGFWNYANLIDWRGITYNGYDVAAGPIEFNSKKYGSGNVHFHQLVDGVQLAPADLLISKDVLQHLPNEDVLHYLSVFKESFSYMLILNGAAPVDNLNGPIEHGGYRSIRLDLPPFNETLEVVDEWDYPLFGVPYHEHVCFLRGNRSQRASVKTWAKKLVKKMRA
jgi:hypothetical protein